VQPLLHEGYIARTPNEEWCVCMSACCVFESRDLDEIWYCGLKRYRNSFLLYIFTWSSNKILLLFSKKKEINVNHIQVAISSIKCVSDDFRRGE